MKSYSYLSAAGRLRRLRGLAGAALAHYDLDRPEIAYHIYETNLHFRVTTASGERFMLRLASPGWRTFEDLQSEVLWLNALGRETAIPVPGIIPARSGEYVLPMGRPDIPKTWNTILMHWVPGRLLELSTGATWRRWAGYSPSSIIMELHGHLPPDYDRRFEHWLSRGEDNLI
jgi:Ser/Thr protein kinase RdoA (MazF antagonist)